MYSESACTCIEGWRRLLCVLCEATSQEEPLRCSCSSSGGRSLIAASRAAVAEKFVLAHRLKPM